MNAKRTLRTTAMLAVSASLAVGAAACGDDEESEASGSSGTATEQTTPEPVAAIDSLGGQTTDVALDAGFVEALTALKVEPGVIGDAQLTDAGTLKFPITGGNVTYYEPGTVKPYVQ